MDRTRNVNIGLFMDWLANEIERNTKWSVRPRVRAFPVGNSVSV